MENGEAFGPRLRRIRLQRGVSLDSIAAATNVPVAMWQALEDDDLYGWPSGVLARAFVAEYARLIGEEPEEAVNDFCRLFPHGDRRRKQILVGYAALVGQPLVWTDDMPRRPERRKPLQQLQLERIMSRRERLAGALVDLAAIAIVTALSGDPLKMMLPSRLLLVATVYYLACAVTGRWLGAWIVRLVSATNPLRNPVRN